MVRSENPEVQLTAFLEVEPVQRDAARGLHFVVIIANQSDVPIQFTDVTEKTNDICEYFLLLRLLNEEGTPVELPPTRCVTQADTSDPEALRVEWMTRRQLERTDESRHPGSGKTKTPADADEGTMQLAPGEEYRLTYRIARVLAEPKEHERRKNALFKGEARPGEWDMERPPVQPIRSGRYSLSVEVRVRGQALDKEFRRYFELPAPIEVRLGH